MLWHMLLTLTLLLGPGVKAGSPSSSFPSALSPLQSRQSSDPLSELLTTLQGLTAALTPALLTDLIDAVHYTAYLLRAPTTNTTLALIATTYELLNPDTVRKIFAAGTALGQMITPEVINHLAQFDINTLLGGLVKVYITVKNIINAYSPLVTNMASFLLGLDIRPDLFESVLRNIQPYATLVATTLSRPESIEIIFTTLTVLISAFSFAITAENLQQLGEMVSIIFSVLTPEFAYEIRSVITSDIPGSQPQIS